MRILISGGGIAGLTLAYWLHRDGHTPVVVERSPGGQTGGYGFDLMGTGYEVAARMGILEHLRDRRLPVESVDMVDRHGATFASLDPALLARVTRGNLLGLMHWVLEQALQEAVAGTVETRYGQTVTAVDQEPDAVTVTLADGSTDHFDLLVGADGIHSAVRGLVFGPEERFARYLGYYMACYPLAARGRAGSVRRHYTEPGRQVVTYPTHEPDRMVALYLLALPDQGPVPRDRRLARLREATRGMGWITPQLLEEAPEPAAIFMDTMSQIVMPTWQRGRVVLVGDACGCMTLVSAQGVSMAMGGAYLLAKALREAPDHTAAFGRYQERMQPQVGRRQRNARLFAKGLVPGSRLGVNVQNQAMRLVLREAFGGLLRRRFGARSILPDGS